MSGRHGEEKPCRACPNYVSMMTMAASGERQQQQPPAQETPAVAEGSASTALARRDCPATPESLGRGSWRLLHTAAALYPARPDPATRSDMTSFLRLFARLYPCRPCGEDFAEWLTQHPPDVSSATALSRYLCEAHNAVNRKLDKPEFDCSKVLERWRDGWQDGSCD